MGLEDEDEDMDDIPQSKRAVTRTKPTASSSRSKAKKVNERARLTALNMSG